MRIRYLDGILALVLLSTTLVPAPVQAGPEVLEWTAIDKPGTDDHTVTSSTEVIGLAVGGNDVIYTILDNDDFKVYNSSDAGLAWQDITDPLIEAGAELPASKIAIAPDDPATVAIVTNNSTEVYLSIDSGMTWIDTHVPSLAGAIQAIAISHKYSEGDEEFREIAIGTAVWGNDSTDGQVWVLKLGQLFPSWQNQNLTVDPAHLGGEVSALVFSPNYSDDSILLAVASTGSEGGLGIAYRNKTWLCIGERHASDATTYWNDLSGYPVEIVSAGDGAVVSHFGSSLALPIDYSGNEASSRQLFMSYDREPDADDDVYRIDDTITYRLDANGGADIDISSIAYYGTVTSGKLLAGDANPVDGSYTVQVRRSTNPFDTFPTWDLSTIPPTGPGNAKVSWSYDGETAFCGTGQQPGAALDESGLSASFDGNHWIQLGFLDISIKLADIAVTPDSVSLFAKTYSPSGLEGVWRSTGEPLGEHWERVLTLDTAWDAIILRLSQNYVSDFTICAAEVGGDQIAVSNNGGDTWQWCRIAPEPLIDMVVEDEDTIYVALPDGYIQKTNSKGRHWQEPTKTTLPDINMLAITETGHVLVGGRKGDIAYSTDGGASFVRIPKIIGQGTGDVQVVGDANYSENGIIYAATSTPDEGIWRWTIGSSINWEQIDKSITAREEEQRIGGLVVGPEGTLYALRMEPVTNTNGGIARSLNPFDPHALNIEFDLINHLLPEGTTFDPNEVFPNTLPYLKLSSNAEQNELWTIDSANEIIYRFQDTLCKIGPTLKTPTSGSVLPLGSCLCDNITNLSLSWEELSETTEYEAVIYLDPGGTQRVWLATSDTPIIIMTRGVSSVQLTSGTKYYWRVRSKGPTRSPWSDMWAFVASSEAIQLLAPDNGTIDVPIKNIGFSWTSVRSATNYSFVLSPNANLTSALVSQDMSTTAFNFVGPLDYSKAYYWQIIAWQEGTRLTTSSIGVFNTMAKSAAPTPPLVEQQPAPVINIPAAEKITPTWIYAIIAVGCALAVVIIVLIFRTRRP